MTLKGYKQSWSNDVYSLLVLLQAWSPPCSKTSMGINSLGARHKWAPSSPEVGHKWTPSNPTARHQWALSSPGAGHQWEASRHVAGHQMSANSTGARHQWALFSKFFKHCSNSMFLDSSLEISLVHQIYNRCFQSFSSIVLIQCSWIPLWRFP